MVVVKTTLPLSYTTATPGLVFLRQPDALSLVKEGSEKEGDEPRFLITMYKGIGDAVLMGLSTLDQIIQHDALAEGKIDVLCTSLQAELFAYDPRVNRVILLEHDFFSAPEREVWLKSLVLDEKMSGLIHFLQQREYEAIFPGMFAPGFFLRLHKPLMAPHPGDLGKHFLRLKKQMDMPMNQIARNMVDRYFQRAACHPLPRKQNGELTLYLSAEHVRNAAAVVREMKGRAGLNTPSTKVVLVASDTASPVTRPPTELLEAALLEVGRCCQHVVFCLVQGHTDPEASADLWKQLSSHLPGRVFMVPIVPRASLLDISALIDQVDVFVSGDTGLMHLAIARKRVKDTQARGTQARNAGKIITLFGGTSPWLFGYREQTLILGEGRQEQKRLVPGIFKEAYDPRGSNLFDHITPRELAATILQQISFAETSDTVQAHS